MKAWAQIAGGALLSLVLAIYWIRLMPFMASDPAELPRAQGMVMDKTTDSLSGSTNAAALTYRVIIDVHEPDRRIEAKLTPEDFDAVSVGDPIDVVLHPHRPLAVADLRWHGPYRARFWLMFGASVLFGAETLRRLIRVRRHAARLASSS